MKIPLFVSGSAAVLAVWLGATYAQTVPVKTYPQLGRGSVPISAQAAPSPAKKASHLVAKTSPDSGETAIAH